jgi:hypothetical protein
MSFQPNAFQPNAFQGGPISSSQPSTALRNAIMGGVLATWSLVAVTPLFATVGYQTRVDNPPPKTDHRQAVIRVWEPTTWDTQYTRKTPIPDRHDWVQQKPGTSPAVALWPQNDWPSQTTEKAPIPDRHDPAAYSFPLLVDRWPQPDWPTQVTLKTPIPDAVIAPSSVPYVPELAAPVWMWPQPDWPTQVTLKTPIPDRHDPAAWSDATSQPIAQWEPTTWTIPGQRYTPIPTVVVAGDQPPARVLNYATIDRWNAVTLSTLQGTVGLQDGPTVGPADNPPPRDPLITHIYDQWEPRPLQAVWFNRIIDLSSLIPSSLDTLYGIVSTWKEADYPQPRRAVVTPSGPAIVPQQAFTRQAAGPITLWTIPEWDSQTTRKTPIPDVHDNPPFTSRHPNFDIIATCWIPPDPAFQEAKPLVNPEQTDNPPIGYQPWSATIRQQWEEHVRVIWPSARLAVVTPDGPNVIITSVVRGGDDAPRKRRKPKPLEDIYRDIQATIHALIAGEPEIATAPLPVVSSDAPTVLERKVDKAMGRLLGLAQQQQVYTERIQQLQQELDAYHQWLLDEDEAEWEWFL